MRSSLARRIRYVIVGVLVLLGVLYLGVYGFTVSTVRSLESRDADVNVSRVRQGVATLQHGLEGVVDDWSHRNSAYQVLLGKDPGFLNTSLQPASVQALQVDIVAFVDAGGHVVMDRSISVKTGAVAPFPAGLASLIASPPSYLRFTGTGQRSSGLIILPRGPLLFAAEPVTDASRKATPHGYLLMGRFVDSDEIATLSALTGLDVAWYGSSDTHEVPPAVATALSSQSKVVPVDDSSSTTMTAYTVLDGIDGRPAALVAVSFPRAVYQLGQRSIGEFGVALGLFGIIMLGMVTVTLTRESRESEQKLLAQSAVRVSEERYRTLISNMADAVLGLSADNRVIFANPRASALTGLANDLLLGMHCSRLIPEKFADLVRDRRVTQPGATETVEIEIRNASGRAVPVELSMTAMDADASDGIASQWIMRDITERKRQEAQLVYLASHDYLTGLFNRRRFEEEVEHALERSRRGKSSGAFLWVDLDSFKDVNDRFGHKAGDEVLVTVAGVLARSLRAGSSVGRLEGDEFGVVLYDVDAEGATNAAERLLGKIADAEFTFDDKPVRVTASIGIALFPAHATTTDELLTRADAASYAAKNEDRNCCRLYVPDEDWNAELMSRFEWAGVIERALDEDRFLVYAQPIVNLADASVDRYELLIRLLGDDGEIIYPDSFLPVAERVGLIHQIDRWMMRHAIGLLAAHDGDEGLHLDVNVSGKVLTDARMVSLIDSELADAGVDASRLGIEITETAAIFDMTKAHAFIDAVKGIGCRVTLDDFGSGFSSFYYLNNLPVDGLKIDGGFVKGLVSNPRDQHIVRAMVELAGGFGIASTAEFVEDDETYRMLVGFGVTYGQGFGIGRPAPAEEAFARFGSRTEDPAGEE